MRLRVGGDRPARVDDLPQLRVTSRIVTETLRLRPPAWLVTRTVTADTTLGDYPLPAGTIVVFSPYLIHHRPDQYRDPASFDPDRWTDARYSDYMPRPSNAFIPFGSGARKCIGDQYSCVQAILILATIATRWRLELLPGQKPVRVTAAATLRLRGLRMRVVARKGESTVDRGWWVGQQVVGELEPRLVRQVLGTTPPSEDGRRSEHHQCDENDHGDEECRQAEEAENDNDAEDLADQLPHRRALPGLSATTPHSSEPASARDGVLTCRLHPSGCAR